MPPSRPYTRDATAAPVKLDATSGETVAEKSAIRSPGSAESHDAADAEFGFGDGPASSAQLPHELLGFELPEHPDWEHFQRNPELTLGREFKDRIAEATFVRFKNRRHPWVILGLAVGTGIGYHLTSMPAVIYYSAQLPNIFSMLLWAFARFAPDRWFWPWLPIKSALGLSEARAQLVEIVLVVQACVHALFTSQTLPMMLWRCDPALHPHAATPRGYPLTDPLDFCTRRVTYGAGLTVLYGCRPRIKWAVFVCVVFMVLQFITNATTEKLDTLVFHHLLGTLVLCCGTLVPIRAIENHERRLFLSVVGARREDLAVRFRSVAATAAAVAPPFAAAQLHAATTPGEALAAPPVAARTAVVGVADVADFDRFATGLLPSVVVQVLHRLFVAYDEGARRFGVDRAGSFADCYVVVAGLGGENNSDTAAEAARRVSNFALWQVRAGSPAASWDVFGFDTVYIDSRAAVCSGPAVGGVAGAAGSLRFVLHGPAIDAARRLVKHCASGDCALDTATAQSRGSVESARAEGFVVRPMAFSDNPVEDQALSQGTSSTSQRRSSDGEGDLALFSPPMDTTVPLPSDTIALSGSPPPAPKESRASTTSDRKTVDPMRVVRPGIAARLLRPAAFKVRLDRFNLTFVDAAVERRAVTFAKKEQSEGHASAGFSFCCLYLFSAGLTVFDSWTFPYGVTLPWVSLPTVHTAAPAVLTEGYGSVAVSVALFLMAAAVETLRWYGRKTTIMAIPVGGLLLYIAGLWHLPLGSMVGNSTTHSCFAVMTSLQLFPEMSNWALDVVVRLIFVTTLALLQFDRLGWEWRLGAETLILIVAVVSVTPFFLYYIRFTTRLHFQSIEYSASVREATRAQVQAQERLARMLLPPHTAASVQQRWRDAQSGGGDPGTQGQVMSRCLVWSWHDVVVLHGKLVAVNAPDSCPATLKEFKARVAVWAKLRRVLDQSKGLLEHVEALGDAFVVAGPFPRRSKTSLSHAAPPQPRMDRDALTSLSEFHPEDPMKEGSTSDAEPAAQAPHQDSSFEDSARPAADDYRTAQRLAVDAARAVVAFCREAAAVLAASAGGKTNFVMLAALGAGPAQGSLVGVEGLTYRLLGLARREAAALLNAVESNAAVRKGNSAVVASPAFRRTFGGFADSVESTVAAALQDQHAAASRALLVSRFIASAPAIPGLQVQPGAAPWVDFTPPTKWRVRGLGVVMASVLDLCVSSALSPPPQE